MCKKQVCLFYEIMYKMRLKMKKIDHTDTA